MPPLKVKNKYYIWSKINSEFSFMQLLVHQKRASLYQDLPWLQRRLVVMIMVNTMTSLSHYHLCFSVSPRGTQCFQLYFKPLDDVTASPSPSPSYHPTHPTPTRCPCLHVCLHFQHSTLTSPHPWPLTPRAVWRALDVICASLSFHPLSTSWHSFSLTCFIICSI